ncbi:MAG: PH domain-containing protein [Ignavibacteriota bacterium]
MRTELKAEEKVVLITRPHWFTITFPVLLGLIGIAGGVVLSAFGLVTGGIPVALVLAGYAGYKILERNRNIWAVTNMRVIDEQGIFSSDTKESPLDKINNVSYSQSFWGKIFGFGIVDIQTAAEIGETTYNNVESPGKLKDAITTMQEEYKKMQMKRQAKEFADAIGTANDNDIGTEIEKLNQMKEKGIITEEEFIAGKKKLLS